MVFKNRQLKSIFIVNLFISLNNWTKQKKKPERAQFTIYRETAHFNLKTILEKWSIVVSGIQSSRQSLGNNIISGSVKSLSEAQPASHPSCPAECGTHS